MDSLILGLKVICTWGVDRLLLIYQICFASMEDYGNGDIRDCDTN